MPKTLNSPPFANDMAERMPERGTYKGGGPKGAVVHFTAGRDGARSTILGGIRNKFTFWCIERSGKLFCAHNAQKWGYHAGASSWKLPKFLKKLLGSVSDDLIGIEINAAGIVKKQPTGLYRPWWNEAKLLAARKPPRKPDPADDFTASEVRYTPGVDNQREGFYQIFTPEQEATLEATLFWLKDTFPNTFDFDLVLGHDEVSGPSSGLKSWRKTDPGAALSKTMPKFREYLKAKYAARQRELAGLA